MGYFTGILYVFLQRVKKEAAASFFGFLLVI